MRVRWMIGLLLLTVSLWAEQRDGYRVEKVAVPVAKGDTVEGYLLVPDEVPESGCPAVVALHDHGARFTIGKEKLCFPPDTAKQEEAKAWVNKFYEGAFVADSLAQKGWVVLVIDALYWGDRRWNKTMTNKELKEAQPEFYEQYMRKTGEVWFERILADDKACIDYLLSIPYVNAHSVGVWGFSMGAYRAWQLAAEDERVAWCAAANWLRDEPEKGVSSWSMWRPKLAGIPYGEIVSKIAPRPMLLQYGKDDKLFPYGEHVTKQWDGLKIEVLEGEHWFTATHRQHLLEFVRKINVE